MKNRIVATLLIGAVALTGCARKVPVDASHHAPGDAPASDTAPGDGASGYQEDLIASAGSDRVFFALDSSTLSPAAQQTLRRQALWLARHPDVSFTIEGHCDERGTREYNLALGDRRAKAAADFLIAQGIAPVRIRTISYGKERPEALGSDEQSYAENRRAVSIVIDRY